MMYVFGLPSFTYSSSDVKHFFFFESLKNKFQLFLCMMGFFLAIFMHPQHCNPLACHTSTKASGLFFPEPKSFDRELKYISLYMWPAWKKKILLGKKLITKGLSFWNPECKNKLGEKEHFCRMTSQLSFQLFLGNATEKTHS